MNKVRCPACRGSKKVAKIGGIVGECNTCKGEGQIMSVDKPQSVVQSIESNVDIIKAVSDAVAVSDDKFVVEALKPELAVTKIDAKKAVFRKKKA